MYPINDKILKSLRSKIDWYHRACDDPHSKVLPHPQFGRWKNWDNDRLWCSVFFSIGVKGGSKIARDYLEPIENGTAKFELTVDMLLPLTPEGRMRMIWEFGRGKNRMKKALGRFFSKPDKYGRKNSFEQSLVACFAVLEKHGFINWLNEIDALADDRLKARAIQELPGVGLKVSRDFLNDIGMTNSLIALDLQVLREMHDNWGWTVPLTTPTDSYVYEAIENVVRDMANRLKITVLEIDKALYFGGMTGEYR